MGARGATAEVLGPGTRPCGIYRGTPQCDAKSTMYAQITCVRGLRRCRAARVATAVSLDSKNDPYFAPIRFFDPQLKSELI